MTENICAGKFSSSYSNSESDESMSLEVDLAAWGFEASDASFKVPDSKMKMTTLKFFAKTRFGDLYSAVLHSPSDKVTEKTSPTHFLKIFFRQAGESQQEMETRATREFVLTKFLNQQERMDFVERRSSDACIDFALCGETFFKKEDRVAISFPFENGVDLRTFLKDVFYKSYGTQGRSKYQREALAVAQLLINSVARLNALGVYHGNVDPLNILVSYENRLGAFPRVKKVRLMDFDYACMDLDPKLAELVQTSHFQKLLSKSGLVQDTYDDITCPLLVSEYSPNTRFRDPDCGNRTSRAFDPNLSMLTRRRLARKIWQKYERYAAACVVQILFDPEQLNNKVVEIRTTERTSPQIDELLLAMTDADVDSRPEYESIVSALDLIRLLNGW